VIPYAHNDVEDLERCLQRVVAAGRGKPLNRRFIVCEGVSHAVGDITPLSAIHALKTKYKFRLVVDETLSFGALGENGRGAAEAAGLPPGAVDILTGTMGTALAANGGWCVGTRAMVDHQRLSGSGYVFSAALPPMLAVAASDVLDRFEEAGGAPVAELRRNAVLLHRSLKGVPGLRVRAGLGSEEAPVVMLEVVESGLGVEEGLRRVVALREEALVAGGVLLGIERPTCLDGAGSTASLKVVASAAHSAADVDALVATLTRATRTVLGVR
jgi:serine palmitoyltransferase